MHGSCPLSNLPPRHLPRHCVAGYPFMYPRLSTSLPVLHCPFSGDLPYPRASDSQQVVNELRSLIWLSLPIASFTASIDVHYSVLCSLFAYL